MKEKHRINGAFIIIRNELLSNNFEYRFMIELCLPQLLRQHIIEGHSTNLNPFPFRGYIFKTKSIMMLESEFMINFMKRLQKFFGRRQYIICANHTLQQSILCKVKI